MTGNLKEPKKPNCKTKKEQGRSMYVSFLVFLVLSIIVAISGGTSEEDEISDGQVCCFSLFFVLSILYLAIGLGSSVKNLQSPTWGEELTDEWKKYEKEHASYSKSKEAEEKQVFTLKKNEAAVKAAEKKAEEVKKLPKIVCKVEKSGNAFRAWSTDGYDYTPDIVSSVRRKALEGNYLLGQFESPRGHKSWRRITATVLKNLGGKRNIVFEEHKEKPKKSAATRRKHKLNRRRRAVEKGRTRKKLKGYETLLLYESPELKEVVHDIDFRLRTLGHYVMFIQIYMAGVDGKVTRNETATLKAHKDELMQGMIKATGASEWHAESYMDETMRDARSLYNKYKKTGKLDLSYAVCIRQLARFAQGIADWLGPPGTRPTGPYLKAIYSYLNDIALADGDLDFGESEALQFAASEWSSTPGYAQYDPYQ